MIQYELEQLTPGYYWATLLVDEVRREHHHLVVMVSDQPLVIDQECLGEPVGPCMRRVLLQSGSSTPLDISRVTITGPIDSRRRLERSLAEAREFAEAYRDQAVRYNPEHDSFLPWEDRYDPVLHHVGDERVPVEPDASAFSEFNARDAGFHVFADGAAHAGPSKSLDGAVRAINAYMSREVISGPPLRYVLVGADGKAKETGEVK